METEKSSTADAANETVCTERAEKKIEDVSVSSQEADDADKHLDEIKPPSSKDPVEKINETEKAKEDANKLDKADTLDKNNDKVTTTNLPAKEVDNSKESTADVLETNEPEEKLTKLDQPKEKAPAETDETEKETVELSEEKLVESDKTVKIDKPETEVVEIDKSETVVVEVDKPDTEVIEVDKSDEKEESIEINKPVEKPKESKKCESEVIEINESDDESKDDDNPDVEIITVNKPEEKNTQIDQYFEQIDSTDEEELSESSKNERRSKEEKKSEKGVTELKVPDKEPRDANKLEDKTIEIDKSKSVSDEINISDDEIMEVDQSKEKNTPSDDVIELDSPEKEVEKVDDNDKEETKEIKDKQEKSVESKEPEKELKDGPENNMKLPSEKDSEKADTDNTKTVETVVVEAKTDKPENEIAIIQNTEESETSNNDKENELGMEVDTDNPEKESSEKSPLETENTEFVQISQDKQDDSQLEAQSMETEDPFGGSNMSPDTIALLERDESENSNMKLDDQADNLEDVIKSKEKAREASENQQSKTSEETSNESENVTEGTKNGNEQKINEINESNDKTEETVESVVKTPSISVINIIQPDKINEKNIDEMKSLSEKKKTDGDEILPGQDDELCIIPDDNSKNILSQEVPNATDVPATETTSTTTASTSTTTKIDIIVADSGIGDSKTVENNVDNEADKEKNGNDANKGENNGILVDEHKTDTKCGETNEKEKTKEAGEKDPPAPIVNAVDNVIDIDDDGKNSEIEEIAVKQTCKQCNQEKQCKILVKIGSDNYHVCSKECQVAFSTANNRSVDIPSEGANSKHEKRCSECLLIVETNDERNLSWETMEFCNEECLGKFQTKYGSYCRNCNGSVQSVSLGKYCVRFGYDVRQFCCSTCLEEFKKGLKVCTYCQKDISSGPDGFLAPVGDKGQFKDFCTQFCMEKYSKINSTEPPVIENKSCSVCQEEKAVYCEVQIDRAPLVVICSEPCFAAFKFVNKVDPELCATCKKYFDTGKKKSSVVFHNKEANKFCSKTCLNIFIITHRKIVPCNWCKVKKYNFDMIKKELKNGQVIMMCSLNCLTLYQVSMNAVSSKKINCDFCKEFSQAQYHLTMSDATIRNFCSYDCVMKFQAQYTKSPITIPTGEDSIPVPTGTPKRNNVFPGKIIAHSGTIKSVDFQNLTAMKNLTTNIQSKKTVPVISSVSSLAPNGQTGIITQKPTSTVTVNVQNPSTFTNASTGSQIIYKQQVITRPTSPVKISNKIIQCKPIMHSKGVSVKPHPCTKSTQTDDVEKVFVPIPVPIYVPFPVQMWSLPYPVPMPFPLPIPVPIFIPTTRNSSKGIIKEIKRIQDKLPSDPFEAELLMMAEMVATEKKSVESDTESSGDEDDDDNNHDDDNNSQVVDTESAPIGDDVLQMALTMTSGEIEDAAVDLEAALTPSTIATPQHIQSDTNNDCDIPLSERTVASKGKKRSTSSKPKNRPLKRGRKSSTSIDLPSDTFPIESQTSPSKIVEPIEKPDANMALKYTFGVNAWQKWVMMKNNELEKQNTPRKTKLFKTDLLQLTADELNYSLCLFVKEVRKPNGTEYAPDTIYYLCLGIQQYLFENNRIDNIFTDTYYEQFTDCLDEIAKKFSALYNDADFIVTRVEEEHLWECKQLGAHSPHVLLTTLMFFNTKHFNLVNVDEHMQLSFSHIMKHWKRNPTLQPPANASTVTTTSGKSTGPRNILLRFYPPQATLEANPKKKKVYEQQENEENPLRCPVKLYEFYLSKCPESVKARNDVFYLLPERSCVPDSPVWYSTSALAKENLEKMLHRVKMVKEINVALLNT